MRSLFTKITIFITVCYSCNQSEFRIEEPINSFQDSVILRITQLQNDAHSHELLSYLTSKHEKHRAKAALAYGSIQDSLFVDPLIYRLSNDPSPEVRVALAYSLGQIGNANSSMDLIDAYKIETNQNVKNEILEALGKCGTDLSVQYFHDLDTISSGLVWGIYRLTINQKSDLALVELSIVALNSEDYETQLAASYVLSRAREYDLTPHQDVIFSFLNTSDNQEARIALARSLGNIHSEDKTEVFRNLLSAHDYRIIVNTLRSSDRITVSDSFKNILSLLNHSNAQVVEMAISVIDKNLDFFSEEDLRPFLSLISSDLIKIKISGLLLSLKNDQELTNQLKQSIENNTSIYYVHELYKALANNDANLEYISEHFDLTDNKILRGFLFELLPDKRITYSFLKDCISEDNIALRCLASNKLQNQNFSDDVLKDLDFFENVQSSLSLPLESEAWLEINRMLCFFSPQYCIKSLRFSQGFEVDWDQVKEIPADQKIVLKTTKGDLIIQLNINESPSAVVKIFQLAKEGYYNGKTFHRVVPNFVAQGGCPRGDGWGSMSFALKSEFASLKYRTGTVGLASAGKDTESCQFFITHSPTPHLDGKYTIIGKVVEGLNVVDQLTVGDKIVSVSPL